MSAPPARDPRNRPVRLAVLGAYLTFSVGFSLLVTTSVIHSVAQQQPAHLPPSATPIPSGECLSRARELAGQLDSQRQGLASLADRRSADKTWNTFRSGWLTSLRQLESSCGRGLPSQRHLEPVFDELEGLLDRYTTHAVQFSGQLAPALEDFDAALKRAAE